MLNCLVRVTLMNRRCYIFCYLVLYSQIVGGKYYDISELKTRLEVFVEKIKLHHTFLDADRVFYPEHFSYKVVHLKFREYI